jgi:four helix bundle protein
METHKNLIVWQKSIAFVTAIYDLTKSFPKEELYCIINQIRRAAVSIPSNIAEGCARKNTKEYIQFLYVSLGSAAELETQIIRMLTGLIRSLSNR